MKLSELKKSYPHLSAAISKLEQKGMTELYPTQAQAIEAGVLRGNNLLLCSGTGSGKTLVAIFSILSAIASGKKAVYLAPLKALASEKYEELRAFGVDAALSLGDFDSSDNAGDHECVVMTTEKFDSLFRHRASWIKSVGLAVIDEIHELGSDRGPTLETVIIKLRKSCRPQLVALSATVGNASEIAEWLNADLVKSDFRPVPLHEGIFYDDTIDFADREKKVGYGETALVKDTLEQGFQSLMFVNSRREAMASAEKFLDVTGAHTEKLDQLADEALHVLGHPTSQCKRLAECIRKGAAFHHAGLASRQRKIVEDAFRQGKIKHLSATVTLVAGVNLPSHRIIIRNLVRFTSRGREDWPVSLYKQAVGRAGRPGYDTFGESVVVANNKEKIDYLWDTYIRGEPEAVYSRLAAAPVLRTQVLGAIASLFVTDENELFDFFESSFFSFQYGDREAFRSLLLRVVGDLEDWGFVRNYTATKIGARVSELYLDPLTASWFLARLEQVPTSIFGYLHAVCHTLEARPLPYIRKSEWEELMEFARERSEDFLEPLPRHWDSEYDEFMKATKMARILEAWISEAGEDELLEKHNMAPGDLSRRRLHIDWLIYAFEELARLTGKGLVVPALKRLRIRVRYGVKNELARLVELKHIGRVRARKLYSLGIKTPAQLRQDKKTAEKVLGKKILEKVLLEMPSAG